jgi:hypothetical protein
MSPRGLPLLCCRVRTVAAFGGGRPDAPRASRCGIMDTVVARANYTIVPAQE